MSSDSSSSPPPRAPPHIRLNSGQDDLLSADRSGNNQASSRSLIPSRPAVAPIRTQPQASNIYSTTPQESSEQLLRPARSASRRLRDEDLVKSPESAVSSRRTSWSSERSRDSRGFENPFADSRAPSRAGSDDNDVNTQTVSEKYNIYPAAGLLLFPEDVEKDDYLHNPDPGGEKRDCDIFTRRGLVNVGGLLLLTVGLLVVFIGYPIL